MLILIYLLTAIGLTPGGSGTVHRTTQLTTLIGRLSGIRTQSGVRTQSWPRKIFTDPQILAHVNVERPDDRHPKLKIYVSDQILDRYEYVPAA